jgi:hypothetical protein
LPLKEIIIQTKREMRKMHIKIINESMIMSEGIICINYSDMKHFGEGFKKVGDNEYKCNTCGAVMVVKDPVLVHDDKGKLKMQVVTEPKQ